MPLMIPLIYVFEILYGIMSVNTIDNGIKSVIIGLKYEPCSAKLIFFQSFKSGGVSSFVQLEAYLVRCTFRIS